MVLTGVWHPYSPSFLSSKFHSAPNQAGELVYEFEILRNASNVIITDDGALRIHFSDMRLGLIVEVFLRLWLQNFLSRVGLTGCPTPNTAP